jgi:ERCC4-type nuclease
VGKNTLLKEHNKTMEILSKDSGSAGQDSKPATTQIQNKVLNTSLCFVIFIIHKTDTKRPASLMCSLHKEEKIMHDGENRSIYC